MNSNSFAEHVSELEAEIMMRDVRLQKSENAIGELQRCITRMSSGVGNPLTSVDTNIGVHGYSADVAQQILAQGREKMLKHVSSISQELEAKRAVERELNRQLAAAGASAQLLKHEVLSKDIENEALRQRLSDTEVQLRESRSRVVPKPNCSGDHGAMLDLVSGAYCSGVVEFRIIDGPSKSKFEDRLICFCASEMTVLNSRCTAISHRLSFRELVIESHATEEGLAYMLIDEPEDITYHIRIPSDQTRQGKWQWAFNTIFLKSEKKVTSPASPEKWLDS